MRALFTVVASVLGASVLSAANAVEVDDDAVRAQAFRFTIAWQTEFNRSWASDPHAPICTGQGAGRKYSLQDIRDPAPAVLDFLSRAGLAVVPWSRCGTTKRRIVIGDVRWMGADQADVTVAFESEGELSYGLTLELFRTAEGWSLGEDRSIPGMWTVDH